MNNYKGMLGGILTDSNSSGKKKIQEHKVELYTTSIRIKQKFYILLLKLFWSKDVL